ncbi:translation initiation factor IF-2-like [Meles meles]|uniref:translation initiation factor IF-2-like n=1 Tax=Meles meles TaxID=9662 RepID=UPI001E69AE9B|nr:translation initiation factor IF-2-like [Meles meles]
MHGAPPAGSPEPRCHRDRGRVRRGARGTARLPPDSPRRGFPGRLRSLPRQGRSRDSPAQTKAKHKGRRGGRRTERRGRRRRRRRGRCCAAAKPEAGRPEAWRVQAVRRVPASLSPPCPCPRASPVPRPEPAAAGASCSRLPGAARGGPAGPPPLSLSCRRRGAGAQAAAGASALPLRLIPPPPILPALPHPLPRPRGAPWSQRAPGAPPRECTRVALPARRRPGPAGRPPPQLGIWRPACVLAPAGALAGMHCLVLHWPTGSSPWALSPQD